MVARRAACAGAYSHDTYHYQISVILIDITFRARPVVRQTTELPAVGAAAAAASPPNATYLVPR